VPLFDIVSCYFFSDSPPLEQAEGLMLAEQFCFPSVGFVRFQIYFRPMVSQAVIGAPPFSVSELIFIGLIHTFSR